MTIVQEAWTVQNRPSKNVGLVAFEEDPVSAPTMQRLLGDDVAVHSARMPFPPAASPDPAADLAGFLRDAAATLLPSQAPSVIGFACTTGAVQLGQARMRAAIKRPDATIALSTPIDAAFRALRFLAIADIAIVSPYSLALSDLVAGAFRAEGFSIRQLSYFDADDSQITSISDASIRNAAHGAAQSGAKALFLSCTGLQSVPMIDALEMELGLPVLSSLQVMTWDMADILGTTAQGPGELLKRAAARR